MRKLASLLILACACAHAPPPKTVAAAAAKPAPRDLSDQPPATLYRESREMMAAGNWDGAKERVDAFLKREPKSAPALFDGGFIAEKRGDLRSAQELYARALVSEPTHLGAALNLARLDRAQEKSGDAERVLRSAIAKREGTESKGEGDPLLLNALSSVLRFERKLDEADAAARQVLSRHPGDAEAWRNLAAIEADRGHGRRAESALNNARKLHDQDARTLHSLGPLAPKRDDVPA